MNFVGDESLEARLIARLREAGHSVLNVHDGRAGMSDEDVLALSTGLNAPVITNDGDFGELVYRRGLRSVGVVFLRFGQAPTLEKAEQLVAWLAENDSRIYGHYVVLGPSFARVRRL